MTKDNAKRKMTAAELELLANAEAAVKKKFGKDMVITSITIATLPGTERDLAIGGPSLSDVKPDPGVALAKSDGGLILGERSPELDEAHRVAGELLQKIQGLYEQGEIKGIAAVFADAEGCYSMGAAGMLGDEETPAALEDLKRLVLSNFGGSDDTDDDTQ